MRVIFNLKICIVVVLVTLSSGAVLCQFFSPIKDPFSPNDNFYSSIVQSESNLTLQEVQKILEPSGIRVAVKIEDIFLLKSNNEIDTHLLASIQMTPVTKSPSKEINKNNAWIQEFYNLESQQVEDALFQQEMPSENQDCLLYSDNENYAIQYNDYNKILMCYKDPWVLCDTDQWPIVLKEIDIVKIYIGDINPRVNQEQARCFIESLLANDIKIAIEHGGLLDWHADKGAQAGKASFTQDSTTIQFLIDMIKSIDSSRNIDILDMDGPLRRMLFPNDKKSNFHTLTTAMDELYKVVNLWKDFIPDVKINLLTNFPNWSWDSTPAYFAIDGESGGYGQYRDVMNQIRLRNRDLYYRIDGLTIDNPYNYALGLSGSNQPDIIEGVDWIKRIRELENNARLLGLDVNMIYNTDGARNDSMYSAQTLAYIQTYRAEGGRPDGYWIQSWYDRPEKWLPEEEPFTMTNIVLSALPLIQIEEQDPSKTSEYMQGNSIVALFFVHNINASTMGVPSWNVDKQNVAVANIVKNMAWWSDRAVYYGKEKSFEIELFGYDHAVNQMDFDPTEGYTSTGSHNGKFVVPIMERLGYRSVNPIQSARAFAHDLRTDSEMDWAFCAFILEGAGNVRAHASLQGPMTVLTRSSSSAGFTFAHEVGHIFGAYDEYWESGATFRNQQSRYGVPNGNFHWRNHPVQPSMMASSFSGGISYYTAAHLRLTDKVEYTTIKTTPPNSIYEILYTLDNGQMLTPQRFQGETRFHWGEGMTIQLRALPEAYENNRIYSDPQWSLNDENVVLLSTDMDRPETIFLEYVSNSEGSEDFFKYLHVGNALASSSVSSMAEGDGFMAFSGSRGLSLWDGNQRLIIDDQRNQNAAGIPYDGRVVTSNIRGDFAFGNVGGPIVLIDGQTSHVETIPTQFSYKIMVLDDNKTIWCAVGIDDRNREGEVAAQGLHKVENNRISIINTNNSNIPSNFVSSLAVENNEYLLVGFNGPTASQQGLYRYHISSGQWESLNSNLSNTQVKNIKKCSDDIIITLNNGFALYRDAQFISLNPQFGGNTSIFDAVTDKSDHIYYGTNNGLHKYNLKDSLIRVYRTTNSPIHSNQCTALWVTSGNDIIVSGLQGVTVISPPVKLSSTTPSLVEAKVWIYPNPVAEKLIIQVENANSFEERAIKIYNHNGQLVMDHTMLTDSFEWDVSSLSSGLYIADVDGKKIKFVVVR